MYRDMVDRKCSIEISQGSIFNSAFCEDYINEEVLGVIITARCDIENKNKVPSYIYISAIPYKHWKNNDLVTLLKKRHLTEKRNLFLEEISKFKLSEFHIETYGEEKTINLIRKLSNGKGNITRIEKRYLDFTTLKNASKHSDISEIYKKEIEKTIKDISESKEANYFLIDNVDGYGSVIVNLRDIYKLNKKVAEEIIGGIEIKTIKNKNYNDYSAINTRHTDTLVSLVGTIRSPYIELLMQRFSNNFIRIGVENPHSELYKKIA